MKLHMVDASLPRNGEDAINTAILISMKPITKELVFRGWGLRLGTGRALRINPIQMESHKLQP